ncbi:MAG TPA: PA14 domain-containing protein, partial [Opitutaceae bacterium]
VPGVVSHFKGQVGYIMWEFGIGRDNCRFAWSENREKPRSDETPTPFHGIVYPDGHPWSVGDARALLGPEGFASAHFFSATYFRDDAFHDQAKVSVVPAIDFDLVDEAGVGSPDASAGVPKDHFSIAYAADFSVPVAGAYTFTADTDGRVDISVDGKALAAKKDAGRAQAAGTVTLESGRLHTVAVRYAHATGPASLHVAWSGPGFPSRVLFPDTHPAGI